MLRAVSSIYIESQALELVASARRDVFKLFRTHWSSTAMHTPQTVLTAREGPTNKGRSASAESPPPAAPPPPLPPPPPPPRRWPAAGAGAGALAVAASLGAVYYYRKINDGQTTRTVDDARSALPPPGPPPSPSSAAALPAHVHYLLVGAGTASFAAMRAIRSARPDAHVLLVGDEPELPYMRPPLSKELWREPALAAAAAGDLDALAFRQWNGKRRNLAYEPAAFYTPVERLAAGGGGVGVARGWRVTRLDVERREASLSAPGCEPATVSYDKALVATGVRPRRVPALRAAAAAGRSLPLRRLRDVARLAAELEAPAVETVAVVGGGFLACELSAALAARLRPLGKSVVQVFREEEPLAAVLPAYLAREAARRLRAAGVALRARAEVRAGTVREGGTVGLALASGGELAAELVVECVGSEVEDSLARASGLELDAVHGGLLVNAELAARGGVFAAGDAASFHDVSLGRRRVEHHDHAVVSGRLAGENMAAAGPPRPYTHQSMFWSDLGPDLGYEAIGIIDSRLPTVGVFSADAVSDEVPAEATLEAAAGEAAGETAGEAAGEAAREAARGPPAVREAPAGAGADAPAEDKRYERGVVFYLRDDRVVGVLLWNLFNRMHVARQVLSQGHFEDLFEAAKLFSLHDDD